MYVLCTRGQIAIVYGLDVWIEFPTTRRLSTIRDLSLRDGTTGRGVYDVGAKSVWPISLKQLCTFVVDRQSVQFWSCFAPGNGAFGALVTR